ncbi:hypothetical protein HKCCE2091_02565 [Rhodobacterales bacterium HKCCE2091]|nr:hypothetical protein [Rhodobacterales bacterium HKCCE2091]
MSETEHSTDPAAPAPDWTPAEAPLEMPRQVLESSPRSILFGLTRLVRFRALRP